MKLIFIWGSIKHLMIIGQEYRPSPINICNLILFVLYTFADIYHFGKQFMQIR